MRKYTKIVLLIAVIFSLTVWKIKLLDQRVIVQDANTQKITATLVIENDIDTQTFNVSDHVGKTALETTEAVAKVSRSGEGMGAFVTSINGRAANVEKHEFWEFVVNDIQAEVGAGSYIVQNGDKIRWKISTY